MLGYEDDYNDNLYNQTEEKVAVKKKKRVYNNEEDDCRDEPPWDYGKYSD